MDPNLPLNFLLREVIKFLYCLFWSSIAVKQSSQNGVAYNSTHFITVHSFVGQEAKEVNLRFHVASTEVTQWCSAGRWPI